MVWVTVAEELGETCDLVHEHVLHDGLVGVPVLVLVLTVRSVLWLYNVVMVLLVFVLLVLLRSRSTSVLLLLYLLMFVVMLLLLYRPAVLLSLLCFPLLLAVRSLLLLWHGRVAVLLWYAEMLPLLLLLSGASIPVWCSVHRMFVLVSQQSPERGFRLRKMPSQKKGSKILFCFVYKSIIASSSILQGGGGCLLGCKVMVKVY